MKKFASVFSVFSLVSVLVVPVTSFAQVSDQSIVASLQAQIASLLAQVQQLQAQLKQVQNQPAQFCYNWNKNLRIGDQGDEGSDMWALRQALQKEELLFGKFDLKSEKGQVGITYLFEEQTASAISAFQEKYRSEILTSNGLAHGTGYVGPATRKKLNSLYGCGNIIRTGAPVISGLDAPTTLAVGETGTWTVKAYDPEGGSLSYSVIWGDEVSAGTSAVTPPAERQLIQTATFTHSYAAAGVYTPVFYVKNADGQSAKTSASVRIGSGIGVVTEQVKCVFNGATTEQKCGGTGSYYTTSSNIEIAPPYFSCSGVGTCVADVKGPSGMKVTWNSSCQDSKSPITTIDGQNEYANFYCGGTNQPLTVLSPNGGESWQKGSMQTIKWQDNTPVPTCPTGTTGAEAGCIFAPRLYDLKLTVYHPPCSATIPCPLPVYITPYTIAKNVSGNSYQWGVGKIMDLYDALAPDGSYTVQVCQSGTNTCDSSDSYFKIYSQSTQPSITVLSPNGGEGWYQGETHTITWWSSNLSKESNVQINLRDANNTTILATIASSVQNTGSYIWAIPPDFKWSGDGYKISVQSLDAKEVQDISDNYFKIYPRTSTASITVLSPNGGESWQKGSTQTIKWQDNTPVPTCPTGTTGAEAGCIFAPRLYDLKLTVYYPPCPPGGNCILSFPAPYTISKGVSGNSYQWGVGKIMDLYDALAPDGSYTVQVCQSGTNTCDSSDAPFSIISSTSTSTSTTQSASLIQTANALNSIQAIIDQLKAILGTQ